MLKVYILRKFLDYSFMENKVYDPQVETVECVKDEMKAMFDHTKGFRVGFWDTNYTNVLKYKDFSSVILVTIVLRKAKKISRNSSFNLTPFWPLTDFLSCSSFIKLSPLSLRRQNAAHRHNSQSPDNNKKEVDSPKFFKKLKS